MSDSYGGTGDPYRSPAPESSPTDSLVPGFPDAAPPASGAAAPEPATAEMASAGYVAAHSAPQPGAETSAWSGVVASDGEGKWYTWRRSRPFWGGLLVLLGGLEISLTVWAPLKVVVHVGLQGLAAYGIPILMVVCGLLLWFSPAQRMFYAILAVLLSLGSWITSNLGGFFIGLLLGIIGGSMAFAWSPAQPGESGSRKESKHSKQQAAAG